MLKSVTATGARPGVWLRLLLIVTLLGAFWLRLQELTRQDIWWDEARNIDVALRPFLQVAVAPELDIQPPIYYWLLHVWNGLYGVAIGQPAVGLAFASRMLSVFAGVLGVALVYALGKRSAGGLAGALAMLVAACAPFWLAESQEARMYTTGFAFLAAAAVAFLGAFAGRSDLPAGSQPVARRLRRWPLAAFVVLSAAALLTHYNAVFILVAWYLWWGMWALLQRDRWRQLLTVFVCGVLMTLLVVPVAPIALRQIPDYANPNITIPTIPDYLWQNWQAYLGGYAFDPALLASNGVIWLWVVLGVAAVGLVLAAVATGRSQSAEQDRPRAGGAAYLPLTFLLTWVVGGLALYYIAVLDRNAFNVRYSSFITPALYALIGIGFAAYQRWWRPLPVVALAVILVGAVPAVQADLYDTRHDREHIGEVTAWLRANAQPGDVIFVDQKYPFGFYYQPYTVDPAVKLPVDGAPPARYLFVDINTIDQRLTEWAQAARRVYWVQWFESDTDPRHAVHFLLDKYGAYGGEQTFQGYDVEWWTLNPPTDFALAPTLTPAHYAFPPAVETVAVSLPEPPLHPGDPLPVVIRWQRTPGGAIDRPLKARVALYDANKARLVQADERLLNDRHRAPSQWQPGDQPLNAYLLPLPADLPAGDYTIGLLVYDAETLEPLTLVDAASNPAGQEATIGAVHIIAK